MSFLNQEILQCKMCKDGSVKSTATFLLQTIPHTSTTSTEVTAFVKSLQRLTTKHTSLRKNKRDAEQLAQFRESQYQVPLKGPERKAKVDDVGGLLKDTSRRTKGQHT
jgi:hypothetical protein